MAQFIRYIHTNWIYDTFYLLAETKCSFYAFGLVTQGKADSQENDISLE